MISTQISEAFRTVEINFSLRSEGIIDFLYSVWLRPNVCIHKILTL